VLGARWAGADPVEGLGSGYGLGGLTAPTSPLRFRCPTCKARRGGPCVASLKPLREPHAARVRLSQGELVVERPLRRVKVSPKPAWQDVMDLMAQLKRAAYNEEPDRVRVLEARLDRILA
jgi:hypothetical protein